MGEMTISVPGRNAQDDGNLLATAVAVACVLALLLLPAVYAADLPARQQTVQPPAAIQNGHKTTAQLRRELRRATAELRTTADATQRVHLKTRIADALVQIASRSSHPQPPAEKALDIYHQLTRYQFVDQERTARLLYQSAHAAALSGDIAGGIITLNRLIRNFPNYKLINEAHFRRAEMYFVHTNYSSAAKDYSWVLRHAGNSRFVLQSLYKRGWARYKRKHYRGAMRDELAVVQRLVTAENFDKSGRLDLSGLQPAQQVLVRDALYNITLNFIALAPGYRLAEFVRDANAQRFAYVFADNLFEFYKKKRLYVDAVQVARAFIIRHPSNPQSRLLELRAIAALDAGGLTNQALTDKQAFVQRYGVQQATWNGKKPLSVPLVRKHLVAFLDDITRHYYHVAQQSGSTTDYRRAAAWYARYLNIFPNSPKAQKLAFRRGDLLFEIKHYKQAASAYQLAAYVLTDEGKAGDAAYAQVLALRKAAEPHVAADPAVKEATLRFVKTFPAHPQAAKTLARLAEDYYRANRLQSADQLAEKLIAMQPRPPVQLLRTAWMIRGETAMHDKRFADAQADWQTLLKIAQPVDKAGIRTKLAAAMYKRGQVMVAAGQDKAAIRQFLAIRNAIPVAAGQASQIRAAATYDAATAAIRVGNKLQGASLLRALRREYPTNKLAAKVNQHLASLYLDLGDRRQALNEFLRVRDNPALDAKTRREAALRVAQNYVKTNQPNKAIAAYKEYYYQFGPSPSQGMEAQHALVKLYTGLGEVDNADFWRHGLIDAQLGVAGKRSLTLAANAALALANQAGTAFKGATLQPPLEQSLDKKKELLQTALDAYGKAVDYGITGVTTEATYHIGNLYDRFGRALLASPRPSGLTGSQLQRYNKALRQQADAFRQKAVSVYTANRKRFAQGVNDKWVNKSLERLAGMQPQGSKPNERMGDGIGTLH